MTDEVERLLKVLGPFYQMVDEKNARDASDLTTGTLQVKRLVSSSQHLVTILGPHCNHGNHCKISRHICRHNPGCPPKFIPISKSSHNVDLLHKRFFFGLWFLFQSSRKLHL